jgi:Ca2+-dependent lipid-binding protein
MIDDNDKKYSVYKGLQRPIQFKGLKGNYIYYAFAIAVGSLLVFITFSTIFNFLAASISMAVFAFGGIIGMALYQRKYGLYRKEIRKGIYVIHNTFNIN